MKIFNSIGTVLVKTVLLLVLVIIGIHNLCTKDEPEQHQQTTNTHVDL